MANQIYQTWLEIEKERKEKNFSSTNLNLKVHKFTLEDGSEELTFNMAFEQPSEQKNDGSGLSFGEKRRRGNAKDLQVHGVLFINGVKVAVTEKKAVNWPKFEAQFSEMFQLHLFTVPSSIQLKILLADGILGDTQVDLIDVEIPGSHVKSLTCACQLIQQVKFSKKAFEARKKGQKLEEKKADANP